MTHIDENTSDEAGELRVGDVVQLREPHRRLEAGTRGRIIGFYETDPREALLALEDGEEVRVPFAKLERLPSAAGLELGDQEIDDSDEIEGRNS
jgi:hypothetical protein